MHFGNAAEGVQEVPGILLQHCRLYGHVRSHVGEMYCFVKIGGVLPELKYIYKVCAMQAVAVLRDADACGEFIGAAMI